MPRAIVVLLASCWITACSSNDFEAAENGAGAAGTSAKGGSGGKGSSSGGAATGGAAAGGASSGGAATGGAATGGSATGGTNGSSGGVAAGGADGGSAGSTPGGGSDAGGTSSGGGPGCGAIGSTCVNDCPEGLECNNGLCVPAGRPSCGGFNPMECPNSRPQCLYCAGCDFGDCFTAAELACVCDAPNVDDVYSGCP